MKRVVKIGGSLLQRPDLSTSFHHWWDQQTPADTLLIIGGGDLINAVRNIDATHSLDLTETHWICVELLSQTFKIAASILEYPTVTTDSQLQRWLKKPSALGGISLIQVDAFYNQSQPGSNRFLPEDWQTTTDSIAAYLALTIHAEELILLKSCSIPQTTSYQELSEKGIVDQAFPKIAEEVPRVRVERLVDFKTSV